MIALLVLFSLSLSAKSQRSSCLRLDYYKENYITDLSECHKLIANQKFEGKYEGQGAHGKVISCEFKQAKGKPIKIAVKIVELADLKMFELERHKKKVIDNELIALDNINRLESIWLPLYYGCIYDLREKVVYIFTEHFDTTLEKWLDEKSYADFGSRDMYVKALQIMLQIARGVEGLHSISMAHNDLYIDNIMLDKHSDVVKLIDFGQVSIADQTKYNQAVEDLDFKEGFDIALNRYKSSSGGIYELKYDVEDVKSIFSDIMRSFMNIPLDDDRDDSLIYQDNKELKAFVEMTSSDKDNTIAAIIGKLEEMLKAKQDDELLDKDAFSEKYYLQNAKKFKLDLFQLKRGSEDKDKYRVESFEELKKKVMTLKAINIWPMRKKKVNRCGRNCAIFRRLWI